jgi:predicted tellurium resistance membrane protein TerC
MTIGAAIVLIAIGAVMKWAVTAHVNGFDIQTAGTVILIVGILGLALAILYTFIWSRRSAYPYPDQRRRGPYDPPAV